MKMLIQCDIDNIKTAIAEACQRFPEHVEIEADALELLLNSYLKNETVAESSKAPNGQQRKS